MWLDGPIPKELIRFPGYLLARLGHAARQTLTQALAPYGLHPRDFGVMNILAGQPGITQQALTEQTFIDSSSMVSLIDELERSGMAERRPSPLDRRARAIYLTPAGEETLLEVRRVAARIEKEFFSGLSAEEKRTLVELLIKLAESRVSAAAR